MMAMPAIALILLPVLYVLLGPKTMQTVEEEDEQP
jgi:cobalt-zinc-cadmium resistance protein CzcA